MQKCKPSQNDSTVSSILTILLITLICFAPALFNDFVNYDDPVLLFDNTIIHTFSLKDMAHVFQTVFSGHYSRFNPLVFITYMIIHHVAGFHAAWFHAINILFHLGTTILVFLLAKEITQNHRLSFICALLFGVHPVHVEPVAWISALTHVMYSFFYLLSVYTYCLSLNSKRRAFLLTVLSFLIFIVAGTCFSGGVVTLPLILFLIACYKEKSWPKNHLAALVPFAILSACFVYLTFHTAIRADIITNTYFNTNHSLLTRVNLSALGILHYIRQLLFPYSYTIEHPEAYFRPFANIFITFAVILFPVMLLINKKIFSRFEYLRLGFFFFLITLIPFLKIISTSTSITNDRYVYLASFGFFLILAEGIDIFLEKNKKSADAVKTILISGLCYLIIVSWTMTFCWRNGEALWTQMIKTYPKAFPAYLGRAEYYFKNKNYEKALKDCERALIYNPQYEDAFYFQGVILFEMQSYDQSISAYTKALELDPENIKALNRRGAAYVLIGQNNPAIDDLTRSLAIDDKQTDPYYNRGSAYFQEKQYAKALEDFRIFNDRLPGYEPAEKKIKEIESLINIQ
jgi:hypothetical protein